MITTAKIRHLALYCLAGMALYSHSLASNPNSSLSFMYQSVGGDAGVIRLEMHEDNTFTLDMTLLDFDNDHVVLKGTWKENEDQNEFHFTFTGGQQPYLPALFTEQMITGKNSFKINTQLEEIWIYHTLCRRVEMNPKALIASKAKN